ncbi:Transposase, IS4 family protein [endosymbiont of Acanthamoeba sp. UWC8]|uniref:IS5 family transposase n=1 Tax=endosymbiont of Acanthamoeba sp. UWC8 TaxID=86106 RepID=UPI0004D14424|nr:IS5 family transposase [endosymbiont of Acanthamoeba sp. UWC8]AIF81165.1 Transposase, IS4 family protein [endosymbiont of Acanthamoeba sp. UWC8]
MKKKIKGRSDSRKIKYKIKNWKEYNQSLKNRGSLTVWISKDIDELWYFSKGSICKRGRLTFYSDYAIEMMLTMRMLLKLPLRQTEGFVKSIFELIKVKREVPEFSRLSKRSKCLLERIKLPPLTENGYLVIDSTGIKVYGESEWLVFKYGGEVKRRVWRKLHIGVNKEGLIISRVMTNHITDDRKCLEPLIEQANQEKVAEVLADGGYDGNNTYRFLETQNIKPIIPPPKNAKSSPITPRFDTIHYIREKGYHAWYNKNEYGRREIVENAFYRYKSIIGAKLRSRKWDNQDAETLLGCHMLNKMTILGRPQSVKLS